jgi:hypothetical protein
MEKKKDVPCSGRDVEIYMWVENLPWLVVRLMALKMGSNSSIPLLDHAAIPDSQL